MQVKALMLKSAKRDMSMSQAVSLTSTLIGKSCDDLTFRTFKQWACEEKILVAHSKAIQRSLYLSDTANNTFDVTLLLYFTQLFKTIVWKARCGNQVKWESEYKISQQQKCTQDQDTTNDEAETHSDSIIEGQRLNTIPLDVQENSRDISVTSQIQVLDDIVNPIRPIPIYSNSSQDKILRRGEAALLAWKDMTNYIKHNYTAEWMPRMSKYFNKFTKMSDKLWDGSIDLGDL